MDDFKLGAPEMAPLPQLGRRRALRYIGAAALAALALTGCGSISTSSSTTPHEDQAARSTTTPAATATETPTPEPDADGDGTPDSEDYAPHNAKIQTAADAKSCTVLGITYEGDKQGACTAEDGTKLKVANRDSTLTLKQLSVHLNSIRTSDTIPQEFDSPIVGSFVIANVTITNRLSAPVETEAHHQFALWLGKRSYTPDFDAMNTGDSKLIYETLQPDESATGDVVFSVSAKRMKHLATDGNLVVFQFSDIDKVGYGEKASQRQGIFRTYE